MVNLSRILHLMAYSASEERYAKLVSVMQICIMIK